MHRRLFAALVLTMCAIAWLQMPCRANDIPLPAALARLAWFQGTLTYHVHRTDQAGDPIDGSLTAGPGSWVLEETQNCCLLHASDHGSWLRQNDLTLSFDDPLRIDALANSWAVVLAEARLGRLQRDRNGTSWTSSQGLRVYLDTSGTTILGVTDLRGGIAYAYSDWTDAGGLGLPRSIVRLRGGTPDASFVVDEYQMQWPAQAATVPAPAAVDVVVPAAASVPERTSPAVASQGVRLFNIFVALALCAVLVAIWLRRDAFVERFGRKLANDPSAWQLAAMNASVSPEGVLIFGGCTYRVGALFFNRPVTVHTSPLFIKVSARGTSRTLVMARKFLSPFASQRRTAAGFTLVESLTACVVFAVVIVAAVFPVLVVLAQADRIAARHETALRIAANALIDEEAALAYVATGASITDDAKVTSVDGMRLSERVGAASVPGLHTLTIDVSDTSGQSLARIVTLLGPPVPPPPSSASPPPGGR